MARKVTKAEYLPIYPIWSARRVSFYCRGVGSGSCWIFILSMPYWEFLPTPTAMILPVPSIIFEPEIRKGLHFPSVSRCSFLTRFVSPVMDD